MQTRPEQPAEGQLIADAAANLDLSIREAARRAGISYGRWRQITSGYQNVSPGEFAVVHAPARTVAKMAVVVGITPERMEAEGRRPDVAEIMRQQADSRISAPEPASADDSFSYARLNADVAGHLAAVKAAVADAAMKNSGKPLTGTLIFPRDPKSAETWDALAQIGWPLETTAAALAVIWDARQKAASPDRSAAGLTLVQPQSATAGRGA